jgi:hypothetical protein
MNKQLTASNQSIFRRVIWPLLLTPFVVLIGGTLVSIFSDRQHVDEWSRDRAAVADCYAKLRSEPELAHSGSVPSEDACHQMKKNYMRKWKRYKF